MRRINNIRFHDEWVHSNGAKIIQKILLRYKPIKAFNNDAVCFKSSLIQTVYITFVVNSEKATTYMHTRLTFKFNAHTDNGNSGKYSRSTGKTDFNGFFDPSLEFPRTHSYPFWASASSENKTLPPSPQDASPMQVWHEDLQGGKLQDCTD